MAGYPYSENIYVKFCPNNPFGVAPFNTAATFYGNVNNNCKAPLPPGNVRLNGNEYNTWPASISTDATLTWSHRNRANHGPGSKLIAQNDTVNENIEGTITIQVIINNNVVRQTTGITGNTFTYTRAQRAADNSNMSYPVYFRIIPVGTSFNGTIRTTPPVNMT